MSAAALSHKDNSGEALVKATCEGWSNSTENVQASLHYLSEITQGIVDAGLDDVVTGFGLLNEPFADCDLGVYSQFMEDGLQIVRNVLGDSTAAYVSDMFQETKFNNGTWWLEEDAYANTYLDSHYYQVFDAATRALSPRQHIAFTCENQYRRATSCCYEDAVQQLDFHDGTGGGNSIPSKGVSRMVGEWSASYDILPAARISEIMARIAKEGHAPYMDRQLSLPRQAFLRNFVEGQIVTFEAAGEADIGSAAATASTKAAWFYWTFKMEGGAFAEWDFLRGVSDGWIPPMVDPSIPSQDVFGSCLDVLFRTDDSMDAIDMFPDADHIPWAEHTEIIDDDVVLSHGKSIFHAREWRNHQKQQAALEQPPPPQQHKHKHLPDQFLLFAVVLVPAIFVAYRHWSTNRKRSKYDELDSAQDYDDEFNNARRTRQGSDETYTNTP